MPGIDELTTIVINKSETPRCFKNIKYLPEIYRVNSKVFMTSTIWEETIKTLDKTFGSERIEVFIVIDSCTAHAGFKPTEIVPMPPKAMSVLQPPDQGSILSFKDKYFRFFIKAIKAIN